jgi:hypothetical protein
VAQQAEARHVRQRMHAVQQGQLLARGIQFGGVGDQEA